MVLRGSERVQRKGNQLAQVRTLLRVGGDAYLGARQRDPYAVRRSASVVASSSGQQNRVTPDSYLSEDVGAAESA